MIADDQIVEVVARAIYESHRLKRGWDDPKLAKGWKPSCRNAARAALAASDAYRVKELEKMG